MTKSDNPLTFGHIDTAPLFCKYFRTYSRKLIMQFTAPLTLAAVIISALPGIGNEDKSIYQHGYLSKEDALKSLQVPEGYKLQLVLSDPIIKEPVAVAWDGNGVMYVAEMRTYMQDADATGENQPISRISRHEDTDGDGVYDKHSIFIDKLLLPRMILPLDDRVMVGITNTLDLWNYRDTNGDGVADEKIKIHEGGRRGGNMEHQPSGLVWGLDNWIYLTYQATRYRYTDGKLVTERLPRGGGQWGLTEDDAGRFYYSRAGGEVPAHGFQQPPLYGHLDFRDQLAPDFKQVHPIALVPDVQGGLQRVSKSGGLNYFTGCAGQEVFRGDNLPADFYGDLIIPEPVGRLIRRAKINRSNGKTILTNANPGSEFIRTRDINFRPVQASTGPDGCLYIVDMHRGIIQQGNWTRPGSYLRGVIDQWGLAKNVSRGRIYRLVHKDHKPGPRPNMNDLKTVDLVQHLSHANGWWRNTAKKLIILRKDRKSAITALESMALSTKHKPLARINALWTLEGMSSVSPSLLVKLLKDSIPQLQTAALRVSEPFLIQKNPEVTAAVKSLATTTHPEVALQLYNSLTHSQLDFAETKDLLLATNSGLTPLQTIHSNAQSRLSNAQREAQMRIKNAKLADSLKRGKAIYAQLCHSCHGQDGKGQPMAGDTQGNTLAPSLVDSPRVNGNGQALLRIILHGMTGPIDGKTYPGMMMPMHTNTDQWLADVATYIRNDFGNTAPLITPKQVATVRKETSTRKMPWTQTELNKIEAPKLPNRNKWKLTASHNNRGCSAAVDGNPKSRYTTNAVMSPGMWFQIELPKATLLSGINLNTQGSNRDYPRAYKVECSLDGKSWKSVNQGKGKGPITDIKLAPIHTKFIRITQTGKTKGLYWSIHELELYDH